MIEALYKIGKLLDTEFIDIFTDDITTFKPKDKNPKPLLIFSIILKKENDVYTFGDGKGNFIDIEEAESSKKNIYLYHHVSGRADPVTPFMLLTKNNLSFSEQKFKFIIILNKFINENKDYFKKHEEKKNEIENIINILKTSLLDIETKLMEKLQEYDVIKSKTALNMNIFLTIKINDDNNLQFINEHDFIKGTIIDQNMKMYYMYHQSKSKKKVCYLCKENEKNVWGKVGTYKFYTVDKFSSITGGFDKKTVWKNYPVCEDCAFQLEKARKYFDEHLNFRFHNLNYLLIPELVFNDQKNLEEVLDEMENLTAYDSNIEKAEENYDVEDEIILSLKNSKNYMLLNFWFYHIHSTYKQYTILGHIQDVPPSRLSEIAIIQDKILNLELFKNHKKKSVFALLRTFFNSEKEKKKQKTQLTYDKYFIDVVTDIFVKNPISQDFLLKHLMSKIRTHYNDYLCYYTMSAYKILLFLEEMKILKRRNKEMVDSIANEEYKEFFEKHKMLKTNTEKGVFLLGVFAQRLISTQEKDRGSSPFIRRLNGLKIDKKTVQRLLPEIMNKLNEYKENINYKLRTVTAECLSNSDLDKYPVDELSFYFALGMCLSGRVKVENNELTDENENNTEESQEVENDN